MNTNYHTQLDSAVQQQNNMLTDIAARNQLLQSGNYQQQQMMSNLQGTPIPRNISTDPRTYNRPEQRQATALSEIELSEQNSEVNKINQNLTNLPVKQPPPPMPKRAPRPRPPPAPVLAPKSTTTTDYVIMPIILLIAFIALVHPTTSSFLEKYLPAMNSMKGYFVRGMILVIIYIIARFFTGPKKN